MKEKMIWSLDTATQVAELKAAKHGGTFMVTPANPGYKVGPAVVLPAGAPAPVYVTGEPGYGWGV